MILLSTTACVVMYGACAAAMLRLNSLGQLRGHAPRRGKLLVLGVVAVIFSVWAIYGAGTEAVLWGAALLAAGIPVYLLVKYRRTGAAAAADGSI